MEVTVAGHQRKVFSLHSRGKALGVLDECR